MPFYQIAFRVKNCSDKDAEVSVAADILNCAGFCFYDGFDRLPQKGHRVQERREEKDLSEIFLTAEKVDEGDVSYGSMVLATPRMLRGKHTAVRRLMKLSRKVLA